MFVWLSKCNKKNTDFNVESLSSYGVVFYTDYVLKHSLDNSFAYNTIVFGVGSQRDDDMLAIEQGNIKFNNKTVNIKASYKSNITATKVKNVLSIHCNKKI